MRGRRRDSSHDRDGDVCGVRRRCKLHSGFGGAANCTVAHFSRAPAWKHSNFLKVIAAAAAAAAAAATAAAAAAAAATIQAVRAVAAVPAVEAVATRALVPTTLVKDVSQVI